VSRTKDVDGLYTWAVALEPLVLVGWVWLYTVMSPWWATAVGVSVLWALLVLSVRREKILKSRALPIRAARLATVASAKNNTRRSSR
jgi:hypothetical protein